MELLDRLGHASSKAADSRREPRDAARLERAAELGARRRAAAAAMSLKGASVLVTGGTRGIGRAIALRLVADGASRAVLGYMRNDTAADEAAALVQEAGAEAVLVRGNVADARVVDELAAAGPYRVVVHNAATGVIRPALETEDKHWDWTMAANARALLSLARATAPAMEEGGSILAISSLGSQRVLPNYVLDRHVEGGARVGRPLPRLRPRAARDPRQLRLGGRRRHRGARLVPEQGADARVGEADAGRPARRAEGRRRRRLLPLLAGRRDGLRPDARSWTAATRSGRRRDGADRGEHPRLRGRAQGSARARRSCRRSCSARSAT